MKTVSLLGIRDVVSSIGVAIVIAAHPAAWGQGESLKTDLVAYWPFNIVQGTKTPDLKNGYDFTLENMGVGDLVEGKYGMCFAFDGTRSTMLRRTHAAADALPANKHKSMTISFWAKVTGSGQFDKRIFSEGSSSINDPLFTLGTHSQGSDGALDLFVRQSGTTTIDHVRSSAQPLEGADWHHCVFVQEEQPDGTSARQLYVDGVLDELVIANRATGTVFNMNITSVGAVQRTAGAAWLTGLVDDMAVWKRGLEEAEITDLFQNGMPSLAPPPEPLGIRSFEADFPRVVQGRKATLRWDVTKDATITITPAPGDVTAQSSFGVGSAEVTLTASQEFTLTITRGAETPVVQKLTVGTVGGVTPGWDWIEDFDARTIGGLGGQPRWLLASGAVNVQASGTTRAATVTAGDDLAAVDLRSLRLVEGRKGTLFFRFHHTSAEPELPVDLSVGLTEKTIRFSGDFDTNIGTTVHLNRVAGEGLTLQARNGQFAAYEDAAFTFDSDTVYNVWIDIQNEPLGSDDVFSVFVAPEGGPRTKVFDQFVSDREPGRVPLLGFPRPDINYLVVVARTTDQASQSVLVDDFYVSATDTYNETLPVPSAFDPTTPVDFRITSFVIQGATAVLRWNSTPGVTYTVQAGTTLTGWLPEGAPVPSQGQSTQTTVAVGSGTRFFRVVR